jgi:hypothetical protein
VFSVISTSLRGFPALPQQQDRADHAIVLAQAFLGRERQHHVDQTYVDQRGIRAAGAVFSHEARRYHP